MAEIVGGRGHADVPFFIAPMESTALASKVEELILPLLEETDMFIVSIKVKPGNNIIIFLDADEGLNISKSASVNRQLNQAIEELGIFPEGDFSLEVGSAGIGEPLTSLRQYRKNIGRTVEVTPTEGLPILGILKDVSEEKLVLTIKEGKKKEEREVEVPFNTVKKTVVEVIF